MTHQDFITLPRSSSTSSNRSSYSYSRKIIPTSKNSSGHFRSSSSSSSISQNPNPNPNPNYYHHHHQISKPYHKLSSFFRSLLNILAFPALVPTCRWLALPSHLSPATTTPILGRKVTGTLFGHRRGHVSFAVQLDPGSDPVLLLEMAVSTASLVKEMASGLVRIALESEKMFVMPGRGTARKLFHEPSWSMYCNGRRCGYALARTCNESDARVLGLVRSVSVGAGVIPAEKDCGGEDGELLYMRARFERVVGGRDSEAFYMMNPDGNGGPELSIFLLRL